MEMLHIPHWYLVYTSPLRAKKVAALLFKKNIEHYLPMKKVKSLYPGPLKITYEPMFPSYVFVHVAPDEHSRIKKLDEVINLVYWLEKPLIIQSEEIDTMRKFLSLYSDVILEKVPVRTNGIVSFLDTHLAQGDEMVLEVINGFAKVHLPSLGYVLKASVSQEFFKTSDTLIFENDQPLLSGKFAG